MFKGASFSVRLYQLQRGVNMEFIKKHYLVLITIICWVLGFALVESKKTENIGGIFGLAAIVLTIVLIVKWRKGKKSVPITQSNGYASAPSLLPEAFSEDGKRFTLAYDYSGVIIVGRGYYPDVELIPNERLYLLQEPNNQYDSEAVSVNVNRNGIMVVAGYLSADSNYKSMVNDFYNRGEKVIAFVEDCVTDTMIMGFYK